MHVPLCARSFVFFLALLTPWAATRATAGPADVLSATARCSERSVCRFTVTVKHADEGWEHYANAWEVLSPDGEVLATRTLRHPHVDEQPFTRSLGKVKLRKELERVRIRARDSKHGFGGAEVEVELQRPRPQTPRAPQTSEQAAPS